MIFLLAKTVLIYPISLGVTEALPRTAGAIINGDVNPVSFTVVASKSESANICWRQRQPRAEHSYGDPWPPSASQVWNRADRLGSEEPR